MRGRVPVQINSKLVGPECSVSVARLISCVLRGHVRCPNAATTCFSFALLLRQTGREWVEISANIYVCPAAAAAAG